MDTRRTKEENEMIQDEAMIVEEIVTLTSLLGGTIEKYEETDSKGNAYK